MNVNNDIQIRVMQDNQPHEVRVIRDEPPPEEGNQPIEERHNESVLYGKIGALMKRAKEDNPNVGALTVKVEPRMVGDSMVLDQYGDPNSNKSWYKGTVKISILDSQGNEVGTAEHTIYPPDRVSRDKYADEKAQGCARNSILLVCNAHEHAFNTNITGADEATKDKIEKLRKQLGTGEIPVEYAVVRGEETIKHSVIVLKKDLEGKVTREELGIPEKLYERVDTQQGKIWKPTTNSLEELQQSGSGYLKAGEYKPRVILEKDREMMELVYSSDKDIQQKIKEDKSQLPKLLEGIKRENKWCRDEMNTIKGRLLDKNGEVSQSFKSYLDHKNNGRKLEKQEGTLENQIKKAKDTITQKEGELEQLRGDKEKLDGLLGALSLQPVVFTEDQQVYFWRNQERPEPPYDTATVLDIGKEVTNQRGNRITEIQNTDQELQNAIREKSEKTKELFEITHRHDQDIEMLTKLSKDFESKYDTLADLSLKLDLDTAELDLDTAEIDSIKRERIIIASDRHSIDKLLIKLGLKEPHFDEIIEEDEIKNFFDNKLKGNLADKKENNIEDKNIIEDEYINLEGLNEKKPIQEVNKLRERCLKALDIEEKIKELEEIIIEQQNSVTYYDNLITELDNLKEGPRSERLQNWANNNFNGDEPGKKVWSKKFIGEMKNFFINTMRNHPLESMREYKERLEEAENERLMFEQDLNKLKEWHTNLKLKIDNNSANEDEIEAFEIIIKDFDIESKT